MLQNQHKYFYLSSSRHVFFTELVLKPVYTDHEHVLLSCTVMLNSLRTIIIYSVQQWVNELYAHADLP